MPPFPFPGCPQASRLFQFLDFLVRACAMHCHPLFIVLPILFKGSILLFTIYGVYILVLTQRRLEFGL